MNASIKTLLACAAMTTLAACGDGEDEREASAGVDAAARVRAMTAPIQGAIAKPTGVLDAETAPALFQNLRNSQATGSAAAFVPGAQSPGPKPQDANPADCMTFEATSGSLDYACLTGGEVSGRADYWFAAEGETVFVLVEYIDVCVPDLCFSGPYAMEMAGQAGSQGHTITAAGELTFTEGATYTVGKFGYRQTFDGDSWTLEYVGLDLQSGSYVLGGPVQGETGTVEVTGENGTYTCTWTDGGEHGSCSGPAGSFDW